MSIHWLQAAMGLAFIVVWLISGQIIVGDRGSRPRRARSASPRPHLDYKTEQAPGIAAATSVAKIA